MRSHNNIAFVMLCLIIMAGCGNEKPKMLLPVYGEKKAVQNDTVYHTIGAFNLLNQHGETVSNETVRGKIYVANFFFATCQSICPEMSTNLVDVQKEFMNDDSV